MLKVKLLYVSESDTTIDYTYQDSEETFPFCINLLEHNELNQECVWNKQMSTPAWMNVALLYKFKGVRVALLGIQNACSDKTTLLQICRPGLAVFFFPLPYFLEWPKQ